MMDKQKQIEEMAKLVCFEENQECVKYCNLKSYCPECKKAATAIYNAGYRKIPEGSVVLTKEEYEEMCADVNFHEEMLLCRLTDARERHDKDLKAFAEAIWDATFSKEVGTRWVILQEARKRGVEIDRELKKYGGNAND